MNSFLKYLVVIGFSFLIGFFLEPHLDGWINDIPPTGGVFNDRTIFAERYKESKFKRIKKGINKTEVETILGRPIAIRLVCQDSSKRLTFSYKRFILKKQFELLEQDSNINCEYLEEWVYAVAGPGSNYHYVRDVIFQNERVMKTKSFHED